jgi:NitT/TauT family transport system permease protein
VSSKLVEKTIYTLLVAFNSVPKVAVAPLFIVWMGTGASPKVAMALFIGIFAIVVDTVQGLRSVEPDMIDLARSLGGDRFQMLTKIRLYCALPSLFAGMKVAISLALVGAIIGEFVASSDGLGYVILTAEGNFDTPQIFAALVVLAVVGTIMFYAIDLTERACLPWHVSRRRD